MLCDRGIGDLRVDGTALRGACRRGIGASRGRETEQVTGSLHETRSEAGVSDLQQCVGGRQVGYRRVVFSSGSRHVWRYPVWRATTGCERAGG